MHFPSVSVIPTLIRENLLRQPFPREPERDLVMDDADVIADYMRVGEAGAPLVAAHILAAGYASEVLAGCTRVLDIGCGPATQLVQVARLNPDIRFVGIDLSDQMLARAQLTVAAAGVRNVELRKCDATTLEDFSDGSFDGVISTFALHHLPSKQHLDACFAQCRRVVAPGGAYFFFDCARLKSLRSVLFFSYRDARELPYLFMLDTERSLRAAFSVDEFKSAVRHGLPDGVGVFSTFSVPLFVQVRTVKRRDLSDSQRAQLCRLRQGLKPRYRRDLDDMRLFFSWGGVRTDPFKA